MLATLLASSSKSRVATGWLGSAIERTCEADWSSVMMAVAAPRAMQAVAMAAARVRRVCRAATAVSMLGMP